MSCVGSGATIKDMYQDLHEDYKEQFSKWESCDYEAIIAYVHPDHSLTPFEYGGLIRQISIENIDDYKNSKKILTRNNYSPLFPKENSAVVINLWGSNGGTPAKPEPPADIPFIPEKHIGLSNMTYHTIENAINSIRSENEEKLKNNPEKESSIIFRNSKKIFNGFSKQVLRDFITKEINGSRPSEEIWPNYWRYWYNFDVVQ